MQQQPPSGSSGFVDSVRVWADGLVAGLQHRLELFAVELQEEKFRLIQAFIWISAIVFAAMMTALLASLTLVYVFWESARLAALGGLALVYACVLAALIIAFRRHLARQTKPFAATLDEIGKDRACIHPAN